MGVIDRRVTLCEQNPLALTGIDFIRVVDHQVQTTLWVFFVVDPTELAVPMVDGALLAAPVPPAEVGPAHADTVAVIVESAETGVGIVVDATRWRLVATAAGVRPVLEVEVEAPGGFDNHVVTIDDPRVDVFFNGVGFNFKQGCDSPFDCHHDPRCLPDELTDVSIDYLARDYDSYRQALLDFSAQRFPGWSEPLEADIAVMLMEIMAVLGDEFAFIQDGYAAEATFATATQRRSRSALARLVDYHVDPGSPGSTELAVWLDSASNGAWTESGMEAWATPEGRPPLTFTVIANVWHHPNWNEIPLHCADADAACLPAGSTCAYLATAAPTIAELPNHNTLTPDEFWIGRRLILRDVPLDPAAPVRAWPVSITSIERSIDELVLVDGAPTQLTKICWDQSEATPFAVFLESTSALMNLAPILAGDQVCEQFRVGSADDVLARFPGLSKEDQANVLALPRAVEREGPYDPDLDGRGRVVRYGLRATEDAGLGWVGQRNPLGLDSSSDQEPRLELTEIFPPSFDPVVGGTPWRFRRDLLDVDLDTDGYTVEEGMWRTTARHRTPTTEFGFEDYAANDGWTVRFGDGHFGRPPDPGTVIEARYFTGPGFEANLSANSITATELLDTTSIGVPPVPSKLTPNPIPHALRITNPLPVTDGVGEETADSVRIRAPEVYRSVPLRAVRPEDYREIVERLDFVQRANSVTRHTGSWSTDYVAADPLGGFELSNEQLDTLTVAVDCVRQAGRDACVVQPDYLDIDLEVTVCIESSSYAGEVLPRVIVALAPPGLFDPDNFTFGQSLYLSQVESTVQSIPGVLAVDRVRVRVRRRTDWVALDFPELTVAPNQIIRLQNDPDLPGRGSVLALSKGRL